MLQLLPSCGSPAAVTYEFSRRLAMIVCMSRSKRSKTQTDPEVRSSYPLVNLSLAVPVVSTSSLMAGARFCLIGSCISQSTVGVVQSLFSYLSSKIHRAVLYKAEYSSFVSTPPNPIPNPSCTYLCLQFQHSHIFCRDNFPQLHFTSLPHKLMQRDLPPDSEFAILARPQ
jgi:hypothetical protein